ncbi:hypothetical protein C3737_12765 [Aeromonas jandaei]|uniref:hypothetical protein n=1 Tax=Aeromonas jandaei TaxID=650 RepID=UPI000CE28410|nr:hypothetical protein [Aeromonas jandaei]PPA30467.1 hypothetical protein C3737_12765 [Aeromonas jandaei]
MTGVKTETGKLLDGVPFGGTQNASNQGPLQFDFEVRLPLMAHTGEALEETEEKFGTVEGFAADAYYRCAMMARALVRLGDIPKDDITAELLHENLTNDDYEVLQAAQATLKGKRSGGNPGSPASSSPSLPLADTASAKSV